MAENEVREKIILDVQAPTADAQAELRALERAYARLQAVVGKSGTVMDRGLFDEDIKKFAKETKLSVEEVATSLSRMSVMATDSKLGIGQYTDMLRLLTDLMGTLGSRADTTFEKVEKITGVQVDLDKAGKLNSLSQDFEGLVKNINIWRNISAKLPELSMGDFLDLQLAQTVNKSFGDLGTTVDLLMGRLGALGDEMRADVVAEKDLKDNFGNYLGKARTGLEGLIKKYAAVSQAMSVARANQQDFQDAILDPANKIVDKGRAAFLYGNEQDVEALQDRMQGWTMVYKASVDDMMKIVKDAAKRFDISEEQAARAIAYTLTADLNSNQTLDDFTVAVDDILSNRATQEGNLYMTMLRNQLRADERRMEKMTGILRDVNLSDDQLKGYFEDDFKGFSNKHWLSKAFGVDARKDMAANVQETMTKLGADAGKFFTDSLNKATEQASVTPEKLTARNEHLLTERGKAMADALKRGYATATVDTSVVDSIGENISARLSHGNEEILSQVESLRARLATAYAKIPEAVRATQQGNIVNTTAMDANTAAASIQGMIDKLSNLGTALSASKEYKEATKEVEALKKKISEAEKKQQQFILQLQNTKIGSEYRDAERQIGLFAEKAYGIQQKIIEINDIIRKNGGADSIYNQVTKYEGAPIQKALSAYRHDLKETLDKIDQLKSKEERLLNTSYAGNKSTYVGYSVKIAELNSELEEAVKRTQELEAKGATSNYGAIMDEVKTTVDGINAGFINLNTITKDAEREQHRLQRSFGETAKKLQGVKPPDGMVKTEAFKELEKGYRAAHKSLITLYETQKKYAQNGTSVDSKAWKNLTIDIENAKKKREEYNALIDKSLKDGSAFETKENRSEVFNWGKTLSKALSDGAKSFKTTARKELKAISGLINKITGGIKNWFKNQKSLSDNAKQMYKTFTSYLSMLRTRIRRKFISMVFEDLQTNIGKVAQMSPRFNKALSEFIVSTKTLGAQIVTAFEPLATRVLPLLTKFVDYLTYAADQMAQFVSKLMGDDTYIKATKGQYDYAASLDETTGKTKKATKAAKEYENTVLSFDQLHKLNGNNSGDDDDLGLDATDLKNMKDSANAVNEIAEKIHDAFANGDYFGAGQAIAEAVNGWFGWLKDVAGWEENSEKFTRWMDHAIDVANGFVDGWDSIGNGEAIGDVTNTLINLADQFFSPDSEVGFHFEEAGRKLGETFISALTTIDWDTAGSALMNGIQSIPRMLNGFLGANVAVNKKDGSMRIIDADTVIDENVEEVKTVASALGDSLSNMFTGMVDSFTPSTWATMITSLINGFFEFLTHAFSNPEKATELGVKLGQLFNETIEKLDAQKIAGGVNAFTKSFTNMVEAAFDEADLGAAFGKLWDIIKELDLVNLGETIGIILAPAILSGIASTAGALIKGGFFVALLKKALGGSAAGEAAAAGGAGLLSKIGLVGKSGLKAGLIGTLFAQVGGWTGINASGMSGFMDDDWAQEYNKNPLHNAQNAWKASWLNIARLFAPEWSEQQMNKIRSEYTDTDYYRKVTGADNAQSGPTALSTAISSALDGTFGAKMQEFMEQQTQSFKDQLPDWISKESAGDGFIENQKTQMATILPAADGSVLSSAPTEDFRKGLVEDFTNAISEAFESGADPTVVLQVGVIELGRATLQGWRQINKAQNPNVVVSY